MVARMASATAPGAAHGLAAPEDVESLLYAQSDVARALVSFQLRVGSDETGTPRPAIDLELRDPDALTPARLHGLAEELRSGMAALNRDYGQSLTEFPAALLPIIATYGPGSGPFAADARRIKQRRLG